MQWECNAWTYNIKSTTPKPTISQKSLKTPKIFKTPKPRLKMHECMKNERIRKLTKCLRLDLGRKKSAWGDLSEKRVFGVRERSEKWFLIHAKPLNRNRSSMDRDICWALNLDRNESIEVLSRICQRQKHLDGSRICWESIG